MLQSVIIGTNDLKNTNLIQTLEYYKLNHFDNKSK